ncbi:cell wall hydrolase [Sphingomonas sp. Leaf357]|uniref:cell wall hydrolase n=1 Tax=Sphingomonas sp. Leaf357 TaxID=1736350 RepID=UPI0007012EB7|nr:cell wall hydrolase [Sphingomonas sp. Leaf357]KQS04008.1 cell wall hydrolase [Sphingomonas sp. Leaf357]
MTPTSITLWLRKHLPTPLGVAALIALVGAGMSAHATLRAITAQDAPAIVPAIHATGYEAEDHFPGAADLYAADDHAAPAAGATGTASLPDLPIPPEAAVLTPDRTVTPAQPFSTRLASAVDRGRALECLTAAIYYEAGSEPDDGQRAVAQVILNRVRHPAFPATVCGVVYQGSERASGCQFSFACDGAMARPPARASWTRAMRIAAAALYGSVLASVGEATHYHTYAVTPGWNRSLVMTAAIGAHFFHRWQGYWGTPQAFRQVYRGGEPVPGPHPRTLMPESIAPETIATVATAPTTIAASAKAPQTSPPTTAVAAIQPAYAQSGTPVAGYSKPVAAVAAKSGRTDDSQILDRWKDSGKPLR